jgi:hypothetical protein
MAEYIERDALVKAFRNYMATHLAKEKCVSAKNCDACERKCLWHRVVMNAPTADVAPVVHGRWVLPTKIGGRSFNIPHCSVCEGVPCGTNENTKYCAICGARMDGE